jgi:hypothetical protein
MVHVRANPKRRVRHGRRLEATAASGRPNMDATVSIYLKSEHTKQLLADGRPLSVSTSLRLDGLKDLVSRHLGGTPIASHLVLCRSGCFEALENSGIQSLRDNEALFVRVDVNAQAKVQLVVEAPLDAAEERRSGGFTKRASQSRLLFCQSGPRCPRSNVR